METAYIHIQILPGVADTSQTYNTVLTLVLQRALISRTPVAARTTANAGGTTVQARANNATVGQVSTAGTTAPAGSPAVRARSNNAGVVITKKKRRW